MTIDDVRTRLREKQQALEDELQDLDTCQSAFREGYIQGQLASTRAALEFLQQVPTIAPSTREELFDEFSPHSP